MARDDIFHLINDKNTANDWVTYIIRYAAKACEFEVDTQDFEKAMIKVAALAVAAVETVRRTGNLPPRHYDQMEAEVVGNMEFSGKFEDLPQFKELELLNISVEEYREYEVLGERSVYRINNPVGLYRDEERTFHRIVDHDGVIHCILFPNGGRTVLRAKTGMIQ